MAREFIKSPATVGEEVACALDSADACMDAVDVAVEWLGVQRGESIAVDGASIAETPQSWVDEDGHVTLIQFGGIGETLIVILSLHTGDRALVGVLCGPQPVAGPPCLVAPQLMERFQVGVTPRGAP
jgi:hypothetical protein